MTIKNRLQKLEKQAGKNESPKKTLPAEMYNRSMDALADALEVTRAELEAALEVMKQ